VTVTLSSRFGLNQWGSGSDPFTRVQRNSDNVQVEALGAIDMQGALADMGAAGKVGRWYWCTDTLDVYRDDGSQWRLLWPGPGTVLPNKPGDSLSSGIARSWAASDHNHALPPWASSAVAEVFGTAGTAGVANTFARGDHRHGLPASVARTDVAQTFASSINASDLQVAGTSIGRGLIAIATNYSGVNGLANGNENTILTLAAPIVSGRRYRLKVKTLALMSDEGSGAIQYRVYVNNGGPMLLDEFIVLQPSFVGPTFHTEVEFRGAGATNVNPAANDLYQVQAGSPTFFFTQAKAGGSGAAYPVAAKPCVISVEDIGPN
jgi:hypothetical protein